MTEPPKKIWTPDQKVPESVRKMAFLFFLESFKLFVARGVDDATKKWLPEKTYRESLDLAKMIHRVDAENEPPK